MTKHEPPETLMGTTDKRADMARLSVTLPRHTFVQLKVHAATHETTIRDFITDLITKKIEQAGADK